MSTPSPDTVPVPLDRVVDSGHRLVRSVDSLGDADFRAPSLLPGWTRAHVVAHLALNGEALERVLNGVRESEPTTMYASQEARDDEIEELALAEPADVRDRMLKSMTCFAAAARDFPDELRAERVERTPGGPTFVTGDVLLMRWRELEIHHADLDTGYTHADWPPDFVVALVESVRARPWSSGFRVLARDLARTWEVGDVTGTPNPPTIVGESHDLAWWLTGRGVGETLSSDDIDQLPEVPAW